MSFECPICHRVFKTDKRVFCCESVEPENNIDMAEWPCWAKTIRRLRKDEDIGVGDTVKRVAAWFGGEVFKTFAAKHGIPCRCPRRQRKWNQFYPYETGQ